MAVASDYPITFPFGATSAPYSPQSPHKGEDRIMPSGTPVLVNGVQIGKSGNTGYSTGAHLHIGKFTQNGTLMPPNGAGFSFTSARVLTVASDASNGKYVRILADGYCYVYLHLSEQTCTVGQVLTKPTIEGDEMITSSDSAIKLYKLLRPNGSPSQAEIDTTVNRRSYNQFVNDAQNEVAQRDATIRAVTEQLTQQQAATSQLNQTISDLQSQLSASQSQITALQNQITILTPVEKPKPATAPSPSISTPPVVTKDKPSFLVLFVANLFTRLKKK